MGTIISDAETGEVLYELLNPGDVITIAKRARRRLRQHAVQKRDQPRPAPEDPGLAG